MGKQETNKTTVNDMQAELNALIAEFALEDVVLTAHIETRINENVARKVSKDKTIVLKRSYGDYWQLVYLEDSGVYDVSIVAFDKRGVREVTPLGYWSDENGVVTLWMYDEPSEQFAPFTGIESAIEVSTRAKLVSVFKLIKFGVVHFGDWQTSILPTNHLADMLARWKMIAAHQSGKRVLSSEQFTNVNKALDRNVAAYYTLRDATRKAKRERNERLLSGSDSWTIRSNVNGFDAEVTLNAPAPTNK